MGHLHHPNLAELSVIADLQFDEKQRQNSSGSKKASNWFLRSGIFMLSGIVVIAGLTIVTISYLENTTTSTSQAYQVEDVSAKPVAKLPNEDQTDQSEVILLEDVVEASASAEVSLADWTAHTTPSLFTFNYPPSWEELTAKVQINSFSQTQAEDLHQKVAANCSNCPDVLEQIGKLEVIATTKNCQMSAAQLDVITEKYYLLTNPLLKRSSFALVANKNGDCGLSYVTSSAVDNAPGGYYFRAHWLIDSQLITFEAPLTASGMLEEFDESTEPVFDEEPFSSIILTYIQIINTLQFPGQ